jgi:Glycosyl hydrolase family 76
MILRLDQRRMPAALSGLLLAGAILLWSSAGALAAGSSPYPAAATRATFHPKASEFAHSPATAHKAASSGGAAAPGSSPTSPATSTTPSKSTRAKKKKKPKPPTLHGNPARALVAFEAMQKYYYLKGSGLYAGEPFSYLWSFSQALAATVSINQMSELAKVPTVKASLTGELQARLIGLHDYLDTNNSGADEGVYTSTLPAYDGTAAPPVGPGGTKYYDDNDWVGIELARMYELNREPGELGSAEGIMAFEMAGWQTTPGLACPGGIPFSNAVNVGQRNTVTTAPAAELALQLYKITANVAYLQFAEMAYQWVRSCLLQSSGMYADHIGNKGVVEPTLWSYNQGTMIGAATLLYQATGNAEYLYEARQTAKVALAYFTPERLGSENPFFVSVYIRNVMYLDSVTHDPPGASIGQAYVNYAWQHLRLATNVFVAGSPASAQLLDQAAIVQVYALLSSPPSTYF